MPSHHVPFHPTPSRYIPSCHAIPSRADPFHLTLSRPIPSKPIPSRPAVSSCPMPSRPVQSHPALPITSHPVPFHPTPSRPIPPSRPVPSHPTPSHIPCSCPHSVSALRGSISSIQWQLARVRSSTQQLSLGRGREAICRPSTDISLPEGPGGVLVGGMDKTRS